MSSEIRDLLFAFQSLPDVQGIGDIYSAQPIDGWPSYRIAKDADGNAALLIAAAASEEGHSCVPIELRNISFRPRCKCCVRSPVRSESREILAVLKCSTKEATLREYFLRTLSGTLPCARG